MTPEDYQVQIDFAKSFICMGDAPDPVVTPFGVAIIQFADEATVEIAYTVVESAADAALVCALIDALVAPGGSTNLEPALTAAQTVFENDGLAPTRELVVLTDGGFFNDPPTIQQAETLRTLPAPVRICSLLISSTCDLSDGLLEITNSATFPLFNPAQPVGLLSCSRGLMFTELLCQDCTCDEDCNANGILDAIDLVDETSHDVDGDLLPDECADCNVNGVSDGDEITADPSIDCDSNGLIDACEIASSLNIIDCNQDGLLDVCEDCNLNTIGDSCELVTRSFFFSPVFAPFGASAVPTTHTFSGLPAPVEDVSLTFFANAPLANTQRVSITLNGADLGEIFANGSNCPTQSEETIFLTPGEFLAITGGGDATVGMQTFDFLETDCGGATSISVTLGVPTDLVNDGNQNGLLDVCECAADCDGSLDLQVGINDFLAVLANWGAPGPCDFLPAGGDGAVGIAEFLAVLANWGPCFQP